VEFSIKSGSPEKQRSACVVVGVFRTSQADLPAELLDNASNKAIFPTSFAVATWKGKAGTTLLLHNVPGTLCDRVLLVGLGKEKEFREKEYCNAVRSAVQGPSTKPAPSMAPFS
jgi:leucyl aminopeptidase